MTECDGDAAEDGGGLAGDDEADEQRVLDEDDGADDDVDQPGGLAEDPLDVLKRCYFDTVCHSPAALRYLAEVVGARQLLLGSDYPFDMAETDPVGTVKQAFTGADLPPILGGTAARLLGLA